MENKKGLIFDMDGTLWDSAENVARSWDQVVQEQGYPGRVTTEGIKAVMGKSMDVIEELLFSQWTGEKRAQLMEACCAYENAYLREHGGNLYPELRTTLEVLKKDYHLYIVSNCQSGYIEAFLDHYKMWDLFEDIECFGNNLLPKGQNIRLLADRNQLTDAAYVGDIQGDYDATMEAGLPFIYAAYGFGRIDAETARIESFEELIQVAKEVLG